ncbi:Competence protein A [Stieleria bergensis]|uniref:Competence protein A n=1 Tax=Stieleria bergensis TaxID=2528025 RepID=A0A517SYH0_9BACT|nr:Competence protein A [Planctomycetes bacterium SV_7m_r]
MAKSSSVWGIEIGQSALKALRCSLDNDTVVADAFDYIEYPKILSQPEADADALIADALRQLIERNEGMTEKICISVPGQSGLSKFFKPPPVEVKKIADLVGYEARQQIPFDLADVVWDYQMMPGSQIEDGYALETEVGLFAMKREQANRQLAPFDDANLEVDVVQLSPIALYNMLAYDRMHDLLATTTFNPDSPPKSAVMLSIGTDSSDLIISNGFRIWQRSMPIGGNHFTRQLTKDLKMTFAKAEHIKRHAREAADPKLIFQTMRPIFNDLVTEIQRSIGFFRSIDRKAEIGELLLTGNTVKMPGLAAYLGKNLGYEVHTLDRFNRLGGEEVLAMPTFRDNATSFAVCYGLCLQGLGVSEINASLIPQEILTARMIQAKKPWTVAGLSVLILGMLVNYGFTARSYRTSEGGDWKSMHSEVQSMNADANNHRSTDSELESKRSYLNKVSAELSGDPERRLLFMELQRAINQIVPRGRYADQQTGELPSPLKLPYSERIDFHITSIDSKPYEDLADWFEERKARYTTEDLDWRGLMKPRSTAAVDPNAPAGATGAPAGATTEDPGPTGAGHVVEIQGYHYFNDTSKIGRHGNDHIRKYLTTAFRDPSLLPNGSGQDDAPINRIITLPDPTKPGQKIQYTPQELGITYPMLLNLETATEVEIENPDFDSSTLVEGQPLVDLPPDQQPTLKVRRMDFVFQFVWIPSTHSERMEKRREQAEAAAAQQAAAGGGVPGEPGAVPPGPGQPGAVQPGAVQPGAVQPGAVQPAPGQPGTTPPVQPGTQPGAATGPPVAAAGNPNPPTTP